MFEDIFGNQNDDLKLEEPDKMPDVWDTELEPKQDDTWSTGQVHDVWSVE